MELYITELSKYFITLFIACYTLECFLVFRFQDEEQRKGGYIRQNIWMFLVHFSCFLVICFETGQIEYLLFYVLQQILLFSTIMLFRMIYPKGNLLIVNNMCMLLAKYPQKCKRLQKQFKQLHTYEKNNCNDIDKVSSCFGTILGTLFAIKNDEWKECLEKIGFFLGKYIYILDAYDDMIEDIKENRYNVLKFYKNKENFNEFIETVLNTLMAQCARYFERLPIIKDVEILRNIIYSGVWVRYSSIKKRRSKGDKSI